MSRRRLARRPLAPVSSPLARARRRWLYAGFAGLAVAGSIVAPALPVAAATPGNINFMAITGDGTGNLTVTVSSDNQLNGITVHLWSGGPDTGNEVSTSDFSEQGSFTPDTTQTWTLHTATDLAALPPGTYAATADATDTASPANVVSDQPLSGQFTLEGQPSITIGPATTFTTTLGQAFTLSGQVNILDPLTGTTAGFGGQLVTISQLGSTNVWTATTAANGSYTAAVTGNPGNQYVASVAATSFSPQESSTSTAEDVAQYAQTSLMAWASDAPSGQQSITGTLRYQTSGSFTSSPAPSGVTITASSSGQKTITTTTDASGAFSMPLTGVTGTTTWQLTTQNDLFSSPFLLGTVTQVVATPDAITGFTVSLNRAGVLTVGGCLVRTPAASHDYPSVDLEYQRTPSSPWTVFGTVLTQAKLPGCIAGAGFLAHGGAPAASAYYRAYFPGDGEYELVTSSSTGRIWKILTRFSSFTATPSPVSPGGKISVSGTLQQLTNRWHPYASQRVVLIYSMNWRALPPDQVWYVYVVVRTNIKGHFSKTFADPVRRAAAWSANYNGNATHFDVSAPESVVRIRRPAAARAGQVPVSASGQPAQTVSRLVPWADSGLSISPFVLAADPLLTLMGMQD